MTKVVVVGSSNTDMVIMGERLPGPGETVLGGDFIMAQGGKGANQAVAAARLGSDVTFIGCTGTDVFGARALAALEAEGIDTRYTSRVDTPSGIALIFVDGQGENMISVAPGANRRLTRRLIERAKDEIASADCVLMQLEVPIESVEAAAEIAAGAGVRVILNPAPACDLSPSLLRMVDVLTPNVTEAAQLLGENLPKSPERIASRLLDTGPTSVVLTMGAAGALVAIGHSAVAIPAPAVKAVDTTAAGDAFNGALAVGLGEGMSMPDATRFAVSAAALSVTRAGAQPSLPHRHELETLESQR